MLTDNSKVHVVSRPRNKSDKVSLMYALKQKCVLLPCTAAQSYESQSLRSLRLGLVSFRRMLSLINIDEAWISPVINPMYRKFVWTYATYRRTFVIPKFLRPSVCPLWFLVFHLSRPLFLRYCDESWCVDLFWDKNERYWK